MTNKTPIFFLYLITAAIFAACYRPMERLEPFRWECLDPFIDTLTLSLEYNLVENASLDSMESAIGAFRAAVDIIDSNHRREGQARLHFWKARLYTRCGRLGEAARELEQAKTLNDSVKYSYLRHRINELNYILNNSTDAGYFSAILDNLDYYRHIGDRPREANIYTLIGNSVGVADNGEMSLRYYRAADSVLSILGFDKYIIFNQINEANALSLTGRIRHSDSLLAKLRSHPDVMSNTLTRELVLRNSFLLTGDVGYLFESYRDITSADYEDIRSVGGFTIRGLYEALFSDYYEKREMYDSADYYANLAIAHVDLLKACSSKSLVYRAFARASWRTGDFVAAYTALQKAVEYDSLAQDEDQPLQKIHLQNMRVLRDKEIENSSKRNRLQILYGTLILSILVLSLSVLWFLQRRNQRQRLRQMADELELEKQKRHLMAMSLRIQEKDEMFSVMRENIRKLNREGKIETHEAKSIENDICVHLAGEEERLSFERLFEQVNPHFISNLKSRFPELSENNLKLCSYILIGMNNRQIAGLLNIRAESVKQSRWRLRTKLGLETDISLEDFLRSMEN